MKENRKIDNKTTKQVVIDIGLHRIVKTEASKHGEKIRERVEAYIIEGLNRDGVKFH